MFSGVKKPTLKQVLAAYEACVREVQKNSEEMVIIPPINYGYAPNRWIFRESYQGAGA